MAKRPTKDGKEWSKIDISKLKKLATGNTPTGLIAYKLQRSKGSIYNKASQKNITLHPTNKSPYNRRKKIK